MLAISLTPRPCFFGGCSMISLQFDMKRDKKKHYTNKNKSQDRSNNKRKKNVNEPDIIGRRASVEICRVNYLRGVVLYSSLWRGKTRRKFSCFYRWMSPSKKKTSLYDILLFLLVLLTVCNHPPRNCSLFSVLFSFSWTFIFGFFH